MFKTEKIICNFHCKSGIIYACNGKYVSYNSSKKKEKFLIITMRLKLTQETNDK